MTNCFNCKDQIFNTPTTFEGESFCASCLDLVKECRCDLCGETTFKRDIIAMQGHTIRRADGMQLLNGWNKSFEEDETASAVHIGCLQMWVEGHLASIDYREVKGS